ncbi:MAG: hypothetical protein ACFFCL_04600 [Promethearchaeota archaeon]
MSFFNFFSLGTKKKQKSRQLKIFFCLFFIFLIFLNFLYINNSSIRIDNSNGNINTKNENILNFNPNDLKTASDSSMLQCPFTENFDTLRNFFENKYQSSLVSSITTYYRYGDIDGDITDDTIFSEDNLRYYKSLMKPEINSTETFDIYLRLKETPLWYEGVYNEFKYGFVKSIDNSTGQIKDDDRYLIDNLMPIFLLIENIGEQIDDISINGKTPEDAIYEIFNLINSSEFWEDTNNGFYYHNSTTDKYTESNFYSVLANLLIHRTLDLDNAIRNRAYELANLTMIALNESMWQETDKAFYHAADINWDPFAPSGNPYYHLSTNALGIITLLEFWIESGMINGSLYYQNAIDLFDSLAYLWNGNLYRNIADPGWTGIYDSSLNLASNSLMMSACLKLFEVTGDLTYYERAQDIFNYFELNFYNNDAYDFSSTDNSKNFHSNLILSEAYLDAFEIYNSTVLIAKYNVSSEVPDFIFNQDVMNLTSTYSFKRTMEYFEPTTESYIPFTVQFNITDASINYLFKYPNGTFLTLFEYQITSPATSHTLLYDIEENLPIGEGYYVYVWANTTYFKMAQIVKRFNVTSGLILTKIERLPSILYQGPIVNVSLVIDYIRNENLTLTASLEGENIKIYPSQEINFTAFQVIHVSFNLTAKMGAVPGTSEITFKIMSGSLLYLKVQEMIEIGYSFDYSNLIYQSKVVKGENILVSMNLKNFLPNATQTLNVSFVGITENSIEDSITEEILSENEIKTATYFIKSLESITTDTITIKMRILINNTEYYSESFDVKIIPKFEIISASFPVTIPQGVSAYLIIVIQNNQENSEEFSLYINGIRYATNIAELNTGENIITASITPTINPYEFGKKVFRVVLKDSKDEEIALFYFEVNLELSTLNLILFYLLPIIVPIGIILFFKNREIKHKKLRR